MNGDVVASRVRPRTSDAKAVGSHKARTVSPAGQAKKWTAVIASTLGAFMAVLNIQIVNASLANIQGAIGAGIDDGGWISTAYLIAEIVVIPLSAWFADVFSVRAYLLTTTILFLVFSVACAFATNLEQMIVLRAIQGFAGGALIPMAFTIIITLLPKPKQPIGLAMFAANISTVHLVSLAEAAYKFGLVFGNFEWMAGFTLLSRIFIARAPTRPRGSEAAYTGAPARESPVPSPPRHGPLQ